MLTAARRRVFFWESLANSRESFFQVPIYMVVVVFLVSRPRDDIFFENQNGIHERATT
jgi:hypothetical protein